MNMSLDSDVCTIMSVVRHLPHHLSELLSPLVPLIRAEEQI